MGGHPFSQQAPQRPQIRGSPRSILPRDPHVTTTHRHSRDVKGKAAWGEGSQSPDRDAPGTWDEDFGDLARSVKSSSRPASARPRADDEKKWASSRPKTAHGKVGSISKKVEKLEETVLTLQDELEEARRLVSDTKKQQEDNNDAMVIDSKLAEKLALLRRDQERNVKIIEQLVKQRDNAQAKARRLEQVLVKEVEGLEVDTSVEFKRPTPSSTSPKKSHSQRPGESEAEYERRMAR